MPFITVKLLDDSISAAVNTHTPRLIRYFQIKSPLRGNTQLRLRVMSSYMEIREGVEETYESIAGVIQNEPLMVLVSFLAAFLIIITIWALYRRFTRPQGEKFVNILTDMEEIAVLMHPNPDPDAMGSALAVRDIAEEQGVDATIYYTGQIRRHENRAFETVLAGEFNRIDEVQDIIEENIVLVDHNEARGFIGSEAIEPVAVIDHHPGDGTGKLFTDVREETGACASILTEYLQSLGWATEKTDDEVPVLSADTATGLAYGIYTDTNYLSKSCTPKDFAAIEFLSKSIDEEKMDRIQNPEVDIESLEIKARAILEHERRSAFAVCDVGEVSNLDSIPQAADELRRLEGINAVIVMGEKDGELHFSARSNDDRVHIGKVCERVMDEVPLGDGGGHARMGGGHCLVEYLEGLSDSNGMTRDDFKERLFEEMSGGS